MPLKLSDRKKKTQKNIQWEKFRQHLPDDSNLNGRNATGTYAGTCWKIEERITHFFRHIKISIQGKSRRYIERPSKTENFAWDKDVRKSTATLGRKWLCTTREINKTEILIQWPLWFLCKDHKIEMDNLDYCHFDRGISNVIFDGNPAFFQRWPSEPMWILVQAKKQKWYRNNGLQP